MWQVPTCILSTKDECTDGGQTNYGSRLMTDVVHGGRVDEAVARFGGTRADWLDLSTGINPHCYPVPQLSDEAWSNLPDGGLIEAASDAARYCYGAPDSAALSLAPGTQMHIQVLPFLYKPQPVAIVGFTYQEHGVCWQRAGHEVYVTDGLESAETTARIVVVVNPNNPDGRMFETKDLIALSRRLAAKGGLLVVDESFADFDPQHSAAPETGRDGLLVMRSIGKFFGLAGVRFGVAIGANQLIERLDDKLGPWAVSGPALEVAAIALGDKKWQTKMRRKLANECEKLKVVLEKNDCQILGDAGLFVLVRHESAERLASHLAESHILVRSFPGMPDWLRFGLPPRRAMLNKLDKVLAAL